MFLQKTWNKVLNVCYSRFRGDSMSDFSKFGRSINIEANPLCDEEHDLRKKYKESLSHVDNTRTKNNIILSEYRTLLDVYQDEFKDVIDNYNATQKRKDRKTSVEDYLNNLETNSEHYKTLSKKERKHDTSVKARYGFLATVGEFLDTGYEKDPEAAAEAEKVLKEYWSGFAKRNHKYIVPQYAVMHCDEALPHISASLVFVGDYKKGQKRRVSVNQAMKCLGFRNLGDWYKHEREILKGIAEEHGFCIIVKGDEKREKQTRREYINIQKQAERQASAMLDKAVDKAMPIPQPKAKKGMIRGYSSEAYEELYSNYTSVCKRVGELRAYIKKHELRNMDELLQRQKSDLDLIASLQQQVREATRQRDEAIQRADSTQQAFLDAVDRLRSEGLDSLIKVLERSGRKDLAIQTKKRKKTIEQKQKKKKIEHEQENEIYMA